jgi:hypothetical protein
VSSQLSGLHFGGQFEFKTRERTTSATSRETPWFVHVQVQKMYVECLNLLHGREDTIPEALVPPNTPEDAPAVVGRIEVPRAVSPPVAI